MTPFKQGPFLGQKKCETDLNEQPFFWVELECNFEECKLSAKYHRQNPDRVATEVILTNKGAMHNGSSVGVYTVRTDFARVALNHMLSQHLLIIIINIVLCYIPYVHFHVHFNIKSYAQLALNNKIGILLPFRSSVTNLLRVHCLLGWPSHSGARLGFET